MTPTSSRVRASWAHASWGGASARSAATTASVPVSATDRLGRIGTVVVRLGPLRMPSRSAVLDALHALTSVGPEVRIGLVPAPDGRSWHYDPAGLRARCEAMVVEVPEGDDLDAVIADLIGAIDPAHPVRIVLAGSHLLHLFDHSLIDTRFMVGLPSALLSMAGGGALPEWVTAPTLRRPVLAAVVATYLRHPRKVLAFLDARRRSGTARRLELAAADIARTAGGPGAAEAPDAGVPAGAPDAAVPAGAPGRASAAGPSDAPRVPWTPDTTVAWIAGTTEGFRDTRAWIRATDPHLSFGAVLLVMLRAAFRAEGITVAVHADMVYDVRRFLPAGGQTNGNLITGIPIAGAEDPAAVEDQLARTMGAGRPVAALAAGVVKEMIRPRRTAVEGVPADAPLYPRARIALSNSGISRPLQNLPWADAPVHQVMYAIHPLPPENVGVQAVIIDRALQLTVSFNGNVFRREAVERALHRVVHEPMSVLAGLRLRTTDETGGDDASAT
ncbi:hypothetical protein [Curtobacterium sp. RRHDQ10]|uniref:hypothetical protein n=1 Tax=Curtobacterium phyllosphaerae TaxID=3413379 RepID=UPI003BF02692